MAPKDDEEPLNSTTRVAPISEQKKILGVVCAYWCISISMVYLNKMLMSNDGVSIDAPLFVTFYQCVVTCGKWFGFGGGEVGWKGEIFFPSAR